MEDHQFQIADVVFGIGADVTVEAFDPGSNEWQVQDATAVQGDGVVFGRDFLGGRTWVWTMSADKKSERGALSAVGRLSNAWLGSEARHHSGHVVPLLYKLDGRVRRVYGRPRRFAAPPDNRILAGYVPITADFAVIDHRHYDNYLSTVSVNMDISSDGGFIFPVIFPTSTLPSGEREGKFTSLGDMPTWPIILINGPVTNPWVRHQDWRIDLNIAIAAGDYVEIDTRPWARTVLRNGNASVSAALGRRQRLSDIVIFPGNQQIDFGGQGYTSDGACTISWRDAFSYL